jgi:hypothetical protein
MMCQRYKYRDIEMIVYKRESTVSLRNSVSEEEHLVEANLQLLKSYPMYDASLGSREEWRDWLMGKLRFDLKFF